MGFHICAYLDFDEAKDLGLKNLDVYFSSGDVTITYENGHSWRMPDMAPLYIELGWLPPVNFINDVMNSTPKLRARAQTRSAVEVFQDMAAAMPIGYLDPAKDKLPRPFAINPKLPKNFLDRLKKHMSPDEGALRIQTKGTHYTRSVPQV